MSVPHYTRLDEALAVGCWPEAQHRAWLAAEGHTGLVSLQSDDDLWQRAVDWWDWVAQYRGLGIRALRVPVTDFVPEDLAGHLDQGVAAIAGLIAEGRSVYVHCNAGLNRSTSTVIAYLVAHRGLSVDAAWAYVTERHRSMPYRFVLDAWAQRHGHPLH
jgi:atypical dual specificity phosphatase